MADARQLPIFVIGAGIAGACAAWALAVEGRTVTLVDAGEPGAGCSFGNAGQFNLGSTLPIALPGMLRQIPFWLADPLGPLAVRWRYLPKAAPWLVRWVWESQRSRADRHSLALQALAASCLTRYRGILGPEAAGLLRTRGHLHVYERAHKTAGDQLAEAMMAAKGIVPEVLDASAIQAMAPALAPLYVRGLYFPANGHVANPARLVQAIVGRFCSAGGTLLRAEVLGFERRDGRVQALRTAAGLVPCAGVVIAAGAGSRALAAGLGVRVPLEVERGYHAMVPDPGVLLEVPVSNIAHTFVATPMEHGMRFAGTVEIAGTAPPPDWRRADLLLTQARRMLPGLNVAGATRWMGFRPSFPDSLPAVDCFPGLTNAWAAFGHGHYGISLSPMTGHLVADLVARRASPIDRTPFRITRF